MSKDTVAPGPHSPTLDPLRPLFEEAITEAPLVYESIRTGKTALLAVDLQKLSMSTSSGILGNLSKYDIPESSLDYYFERMNTVVLPNVFSLMTTFRRQRAEIIHTRIQSMTADGRDRSSGHKRLHVHVPPGSEEGEFLKGAEAAEDEIVLNKTASGVFSSTNLDYLLRNLKITGLFIVGVYSNECVSTAVREGCDRGYSITLIEDACASVTYNLHRATMDTLKNRYARVISTQEAIEELESLMVTSPESG